MATKAQIIDFLLAGYRHPTTDLPLSAGTIDVTIGGTSNTAYVWTDRDKTLPTTTGISTITLDAAGKAEIYGDGIYKFVIKDSTGATVETIDNLEYLPIDSGGAAVANQAALSAISVTSLANNTPIFIQGRVSAGDGGHGHFYWDSSDLSAQVTADTQSGFYVPPDSDTTGSSGAWVLQNSGDVNVIRFGAVAGTSQDNSTAINAALTLNVGPVFVPKNASPYRVDTQITVPDGQKLRLERGAILRRYTAQSAATTPVVFVKGSYTQFEGGEVVTENASPSGVIRLGHEDTTASTNYDALYWRLIDCRIVGVQSAGNIGVSLVSSQATTGKANYFGTINNIEIRNADIGLQCLSTVNAHQMYNVQFWNMITSAYQLQDAYANSVFGGFVHTSTNGVIGIQLLGVSLSNKFYGVGIEPGGATSKSVYIDTNCTGNSVKCIGNTSGGTTVLNTSNDVDTTYATVTHNTSRTNNFGSINIDGISKHESAETYANDGTVVENTAQDIFSVSPATRAAYLIEINVVARNGALDRITVLNNIYSVHNFSGTAVVELISNSASTAANAVTITTGVSTSTATFTINGVNNGTGTTYNYGWTARIQNHTGDISTTALTILD